jgi:ATP-dependent protease ClpP protease subunit
MFKYLVTLALSLAVSASAFAKSKANSNTFELNPKRLIEVIDVVDVSAVTLAQKVHNLAAQSKEPIDFLINSPGGAIVPGYMLVDAMDAVRSQGIKIRCAVGVLAASMAFNMLAHCDERVALSHAALLFHPPRIFSRNALTINDLLTAAEDLQRVVDSSTGELISMLGMSEESFYKHFYSETLWTASDLRKASGRPWIRIVKNITGSDKVFTFEKPRSFFFFGMANYEIIHVSPVTKAARLKNK